MGHTTIKDVAQKAEVSIATVSRVLNELDNVSPATRQKVLDACDELGYSPNMQAKRLKLGFTNSIAAVMPFLTLPSIVERLRGVQATLAESEYDLFPFSVENPEERDQYLERLANRSLADGVLIISMPISSEQVARFRRIDMPVVLIDSFQPGCSRVFTDDVLGGKMATEHLLDLGHRRIGFLSDHLDLPMQFSSTRDRFQGYRLALEENGIPFDPAYQKQGPHGREAARAMALELLTTNGRPTAIFAASDTQAIGVLDAARELDLSVPDELSVVGYDDIRDAEYVHLTTIRQPLFDTGKIGGKILIEQIAQGCLDEQEALLPLSIITRSTTAPSLRS